MAQTSEMDQGKAEILTLATHRNEFQRGIPWRVALQQSPPPLSPLYSFCNKEVLFVQKISANGNCRTSQLSQKRAQSNPQRITKFNSIQQPIFNRFNINHLRTTNFNRVQQALESGSGPGDGGSNPLCPTIIFNSLHSISGPP